MGRILFTPHKNLIFPVKYGLLYNWYAATDVRKITSSDTWRMCTHTEISALITALGGSTVAGGKLKETGLTYWLTPNTGASNLVNFNARGSGTRLYNNGEFSEMTRWFESWYNSGIPNGRSGFRILYNTESVTSNGAFEKQGRSIRLMRPASAAEQLLDDGTYCEPYTGNDGKIYRTVKIGSQIWLGDNLAETKFRNGDWIHGFDGGVYTPISNEDWATLTTGALCAYDNDWNNV